MVEVNLYSLWHSQISRDARTQVSGLVVFFVYLVRTVPHTVYDLRRPARVLSQPNYPKGPLEAPL